MGRIGLLRDTKDYSFYFNVLCGKIQLSLTKYMRIIGIILLFYGIFHTIF